MPFPSHEMEHKNHDAPILFEENIKGKSNDADINQGEYAQAKLHLSTTHATIQQSFVEPIATFPLSQVHLVAIPCDKQELCDASLISMPQQVNEHVIPIVELFVVDEDKHVVHIIDKKEELYYCFL